jgi:hypothetical protein
VIITDCLGREREVTRTWPDGSYNCPFCDYAVPAAGLEFDHGVKDLVPVHVGCQNPACFARVNPPYPADRAREDLRCHEAQLAEEVRRKREVEWVRQAQKQRTEEHAVWQASQRAECVTRGCCLNCLFQPGWQRVKFVKHRKVCPRQTRGF